MKNYIIRKFPKLVGTYDYYFNPTLHASWGGPFNGQDGRQQIFRELIAAIPFRAMVETGTFRGTTTEYMAQQSGIPIFSIETQPRFYQFAKLRLRSFPHVRVVYGDSRRFLESLARDPKVPKENVFFYLDAHWLAELPLREEVTFIAKHWRSVAIMIDDFRVPGDPGYTFDDDGPERRLCLEYLGNVRELNLTAFFPSLPSDRETGSKRGCVVLADDPLSAICRTLPTLREFN
jgi:hypothetical protein